MSHNRDDWHLLDAYWRAANYLSVGQIYLLDNPWARRSETDPLAARKLIHLRA